MKKIVLIVLMLLSLFMFVLCLERAHGFFNQTNKIEIEFDFNNKELTLKNNQINQSISVLEVEIHRIHDESNQTIVHHIKHDDFHLMFLEHEETTSYYTEVIIWQEPVITFEAKADINVFSRLFKSAQPILNTSDLGIELLSNQGVFEKYHFNTESRSRFWWEIEEPFTISQMTQSNKLLMGYEPQLSWVTSPVYSDQKIIRIIPESWFFRPGTHVYVGRTYGVVVTTTFHENHSFFGGGNVFSSTVLVFRVDAGLPFMERLLEQDSNSSIDLSNKFNSTEQFSLTITPIIEENFWSFRRVDIPVNSWDFHRFDPNVNRMIWRRTNINERIFVAPSHNAILVDHNIPSNRSKTSIYGIQRYEFTPTLLSSLDQQLTWNDTNNKSSVLSFISLADVIGVLSLPIGATIVLTLKSIINRYQEAQKIFEEGVLHDQIKEESANNSIIRSFTDPFGPDGSFIPYPHQFSAKFGSFQKVFSNRALREYHHQLRVTLRNYDFESSKFESFAIANQMRYVFFNHKGEPLVNPNGSEVEFYRFDYYENFNHHVGHHTTVRQLNTNTAHQITVASAFERPSLTFRNSGTTRLIRVNISEPSISLAFVDVYNQQGRLMHTLNIGWQLQEDSRLMRIINNEMYHFVLRFNNNQTGSVMISFEEIPIEPKNATNSGSLTITDKNSQRNTFFHIINFTHGRFSMTTISNMDTRFSLYCVRTGRKIFSSHHLLNQGSEDIPDLNDVLSFRLDLAESLILVVTVNRVNVEFSTIIHGRI